MLTNILIVIAALILVVLVLAAMKPASFRIERTTTINAPADRVFALINDFHNWGNWSPWETIDPSMTRVFSGSPSGVGAIYGWDGNKKAGAGRMEISKSVAPSAIDLRIDFTRPFKANDIIEFRTDTRQGATRVTWVMHGSTAFMTKVARVFVNMDNLIGKDFDRGLANMKAIAEKQG